MGRIGPAATRLPERVKFASLVRYPRLSIFNCEPSSAQRGRCVSVRPEAGSNGAILPPTGSVAGRPFAAAMRTRSDAGVMREMLSRERVVARVWAEERATGGWTGKYRSDRRHHWLAVPDREALVAAEQATAVGFFGQRREDVDHTELFALEQEIVDGLAAYAAAGLLSYYNMRRPNGRYGNLILFRTRDVPQAWRTNPVHERAVTIAPRHYHSARLHRGSVPGNWLEDGELTIEQTRYFDFDGDDIWRAFRRFV
jgi:hypothetical protein